MSYGYKKQRSTQGEGKRLVSRKNFVTFTEKIINGKLNFLCSVSHVKASYWERSKMITI